MTKELKAYIAAAAECGKAAFAAGIKCAPALDPAFGEVLKKYSAGKPIGYSIKALEAWHRAWAVANLAAAVDLVSE